MRGDFYVISETDQLFGITGKRAADRKRGIRQTGKSGEGRDSDGAAEGTGGRARQGGIIVSATGKRRAAIMRNDGTAGKCCL